MPVEKMKKKKTVNARVRQIAWGVAGLVSLLVGGQSAAAELAAAAAATAMPAPDSASLSDEDRINLLLDEGKPEEALLLNQQALNRARQDWGERDVRTLELLSLLGSVYSDLGRYAESLDVRERLLGLRIEVQGPEHLKTLTDAGNRLVSLMYLGRFHEAKREGAKLLEVQLRVLGERHPLTLVGLQNQAVLLSRLAEWSQAMRLYEQVLRLQTELLGPKHPDRITVLANYAISLMEVGRVEEAEVLARQVLQLRTEVLGPAHADTAMAMSNLAVVLRLMGRTEESEQRFVESAQLTRRALGDDHPLSLRQTSKEAASLVEMGKTDAAIRLLTEVIAAFEHKGQAEHVHCLNARQMLGRALGAAGRWAEAEAAFRRASQGFDRLGDKASSEAVASHFGWAQAQAKLGDVAGAIARLQALSATLESQREQMVELSESARRQWLLRYVGIHQELLSQMLATGQVEAAFNLSEAAKARVLLEQMAQGEAAARADLPPQQATELLALQEQLAQAAAPLANLGEAGERQALQARVNALSRELAQLQTRLATESPRYAQLARPVLARAADAQRLLQAGSVFLSYVRMPGQRVRAVTVDANAQVRWHDLGVLPGLEHSIDALRAALVGAPEGQAIWRWQQAGQPRWRSISGTAICSAADMRILAGESLAAAQSVANLGLASAAAAPECVPPGAVRVAPREARQDIVAALSDFLLAPLRKQGGEPKTRRLLIAPDGPLWLLPWDLLKLDGRPLAQAVQVQQVHSLSVLQMVQQRLAARSGADSARLLAFGNPSYPQTAQASGADAGTPRSGRPYALRSSPLRAGQSPQEAGVALSSLSWPRLPFAQFEMDQVGRLFKPAQVTQVSGDAATETRLRELSASGELAKYRYLLFSAHGYFDPVRPEFSSLVLKPDGEDVRHDGFVSLAEWLPLRLNSDLVVLSACETARGRELNGEGLLGLSYALFVAGNANTVATLWPVADRETALLVSRFFAHVHRGLKPAQALARTKREFISHPNARLRDPRHWAAFVLYGA
ncbi:CHAT domain-containing protein [Paucibacter sp. AS339]|uniref:CHAT domain-containing tetratricopeptide repeat protein n=1 Tax=Paucibacter hankyongi TaxID=3133434 RepID=UPI0030955D70